MRTNKQILFLNAFAIILVCIGHSFTAIESYYGHKWIYGFHMPLFMFISGYLLKYTAAYRQQEVADIPLFGRHGYISKRAIRLLVPYLIVSSIAYIPKVLLNAYALRPIEFSFHSYMHMIFYPKDNVIKFFWFLPTLYIVNILTVLLYKFRKKWKLRLPSIICILLLIILYEYNPISEIVFLNIGEVGKYLIFFITGCVFAKYDSKSHNITKLANIQITCFLLVLYSALIYWVDWNTPFIGIIYAFIGILFSFSLSALYERYHLKILNHFYNSSYAIYLFSWYPLVIIQSFFMKRYELNWISWSIISTIIQIFIPFCIYKVIIYIKNNKRYGKIIATLLGQ